MVNLAIISVFFILIDLGLLMVIMGQYKEMDTITKKNEELKTAKRVFYDNLQYEINFKKSLQDIKTNGEQKLKDMEANQPKLTKQLEDKKSEAAACQEQIVAVLAQGSRSNLKEPMHAERKGSQTAPMMRRGVSIVQRLFILMLGVEPVLLKTKNQELASLEETLKSVTATFNAESEVWKQEIITLKANLSAPSPICKYVTKNEKPGEFCATQPTQAQKKLSR